eukprot:SAG22_NODE_13912_length_391_cov_0.678082_1_plen_79_part_10
MIGSIACSEERKRGNQYAPEVSAVVIAARRGLLGSQRRLEVSRKVRRIETKISELGAHELDGLVTVVVRKGRRDCQELV